MIVDARRVRNALHHLFEKHGNIVGRHAWMEFLSFGRFVSDGLHGEMQHDFVAAAMRFFGDLDGMRMIRQDGDGQRIRQSEDRVGSSAIVAEIVKNDGQPRGAVLLALPRTSRGRRRVPSER